MSNAQLQLQFPTPGQWDQFALTAVYPDAEGYTRTDRYTQDKIPADQAPAMASVVSALVGLAEPWQASQVWARLVQLTSFPPADGDLPPAVVVTEAVELTVEAVNDQGGRRTFTAVDYPEFVIAAPAAVEFFRRFTTVL